MWISKKKLAEIKAECFDDGKRAEKGECQQLVTSSARIEQKNTELLKECAELKKRVRTQSKADMILEAIKVITEGLKEPDQALPQTDMSNYYAAMQSAQTQYRGQYSSGASGLYTGILGGLIR